VLLVSLCISRYGGLVGLVVVCFVCGVGCFECVVSFMFVDICMIVFMRFMIRL